MVTKIDRLLQEVEVATKDAALDLGRDPDTDPDVWHDVFQSLLWVSDLNYAERKEAARITGYGGRLYP